MRLYSAVPVSKREAKRRRVRLTSPHLTRGFALSDPRKQGPWVVRCRGRAGLRFLVLGASDRRAAPTTIPWFRSTSLHGSFPLIYNPL